jgi:hypothetical protein
MRVTEPGEEPPRWTPSVLAVAEAVLCGRKATVAAVPYLTEVATADVYVDGETMASLEAIAAEAGLRPIDGGRLTLRPFPTTTARSLATETAGLQVAPWPRVYADLRMEGVRGEEAAEHLREFRHGR